jgi:hypothetical protein
MAGARGEAWRSGHLRPGVTGQPRGTRQPESREPTSPRLSDGEAAQRAGGCAHCCGPSGGRGEPDGPGEPACPLRFSPQRRFLCVGEEASREPSAASSGAPPNPDARSLPGPTFASPVGNGAAGAIARGCPARSGEPMRRKRQPGSARRGFKTRRGAPCRQSQGFDVDVTHHLSLSGAPRRCVYSYPLHVSVKRSRGRGRAARPGSGRGSDRAKSVRRPTPSIATGSLTRKDHFSVPPHSTTSSEWSATSRRRWTRRSTSADV